MRRSLFKKIEAISLAVVMIVSMAVIPAGSVKADEIKGYIAVDDYSKEDDQYSYTERYLYSYWSRDDETVVDSYSGMTYDLATNTLTMDGCKNTKIILRIDGMGKDFKINLKGDNAIGSVDVMMTGISIIGTGTLTVNADKTQHAAFKLSGQTPPPYETDEDFEYVNGSLHIGPDATVTTYSGIKEEGGNNIEIIWATSDKIDGVLSYEGDISAQLDYQTNEIKGKTNYDYYNNDTYAYHSVSSDYLYTDDGGNLYLKYDAEGYSDDYLLVEKHNNKWYVSNAITYGSSISDVKKCDNIPSDFTVSNGKISVYELINYKDYDENNLFVLMYGYTKNGKTYVIMPKKSLSWYNDNGNESSTAYCVAEITKDGTGFELGYNYIAPWVMDVASVTDVANVTDYKQAAEYMEKNGYVKKGYTEPTMYEYIVTNDVLTFSPKKAIAPTPSGDDKKESTGDKTTTDTTTTGTQTTGTTSTDTVTKVEKDAVVSDQTTGATYKVTEASTSGTVEVEYKPAGNTKKKEIVIPSKVDLGGVEAEVTSIADNAFAGNTTVTKVTIPATIKTIGKGAFKNCKKLNKITIAKNVKSIGKDAFSGDKKLKTITINSTKIKSIGKNAFKNVPKSATVKVPKKQKKAYTKLLKSAGFKGKVKTK